MQYITQQQYYTNPSNWGSYQYVSLYDIVDNFLLMYMGNHSLVNNEERYKVLFHAKRAIQELNYDALKEVKALELVVPSSTLAYILPSDYVNWVRISLYKDGYLRPLTENIQTISSVSYAQNGAGTILFSGSNASVDVSTIDANRLAGTKKSIYLNGGPYHGQYGYEIDGEWYFDFPAFGLNTETANFNPTFNIDKRKGVINFDSSMGGQNCILEYISDGMENGNDGLVSVNKLFEKYIYAYINYEILNSKLGVQEYIVNRARKEKTALLRNAKIRISNIHPGRLLMNLRGMDKIIK